MNRIVIRTIGLVLCALTLNGCAIAQFYLDSEFHRNRRFYANYRPPAEINGRGIGTSVTAPPDRSESAGRGGFLQLINGDGFKYRPRDKRRMVVASYAAYFDPSDNSPFAAPARVSSIEYFYCALDGKPHLCGGKIAYESEEIYSQDVHQDEDVLSKIRHTNHELIIDELVSRHGRSQINEATTHAGPPETEKNIQVVTEDEFGAVYRSGVDRDQRRVWCDFSKGVPRQCRRSIIALFSPSIGHGTIIYIDALMYDYLRLFEKELKHRHPSMNVIKHERSHGGALSPEDQSWMVGRLLKSARHAYMPWGKLPTEIELEAQAKASGKPRPQIKRKMTQEEFQREWVTAWVSFDSGPSVARPYWLGYLEAILARDFDHQFQRTNEAHHKWTVLSREFPSTASVLGDGYIHGLVGKRQPRYSSAALPNFSPDGFNCCEDTGMNLLRKVDVH